MMAKRNKDSVTGTVTKPWAGRSGPQIPAQATDCSLSKTSGLVLEPNGLRSMGGSRVLSHTSICHFHLTLRLTMSTATPLPTYRPHAVDTANFTVHSMASQLPCSPQYHRSPSGQWSSPFHYTRL